MGKYSTNMKNLLVPTLALRFFNPSAFVREMDLADYFMQDVEFQ